MNENAAASDWAAKRGEKWRAQLAGMEAMLAPVNEPLIRGLCLDAPYQIADIGCGGGGSTLEIARRAVPGSEVHGFDISPALIDLARARSVPKGSPVTFEIADMATTAPKQIYDRLASRFGIMFFDDPGSAFGNLFRWLTPGGRFAFAVWGPQAQNPWMTTVRDAAAEIIDLASPDPAAPGPFRYAEVDPLRGHLDRAGFSELEVIGWNGELRIGGGLPAAEAAEFALASFASFGELLADAGGEALNDARRSLTARFSPHQRDGVVTMDACVYIVTGMRGMAR